MKFEFYVLNYNHSTNKVAMYNIFNNIRVQKSAEDAVKKYLQNPEQFPYKPFGADREILYGFQAFMTEIDSIIAWQEHARFEYECSCGYAFEKDCNNLEKIDCYYQAHANIKTIAYEIIRQYKEQMQEEK